MSKRPLSWTAALSAAVVALPAQLVAQAPVAPVNDRPNPYSAPQVPPLPNGRPWGSTAGVDIAPDGKTVWAIDRCGSNTCVGSDLDPIIQFDGNGRFVKSFGRGLFAFPHGIHVDPDGNIWVTDPLPPDGRGAGGSVGQQVTKLSPNGEVLMALGTRTVTGTGPNEFSSPSDVVVGRNGDIFVADGHGPGTTERIVKYDRNGNFIKQWGRPGTGACGTNEFGSVHALEIDGQGRLYVGDRDNNRIQIFDQDGNYITCWYQFGRPSGIHIDGDNIYVADSESAEGDNPGWLRGIRVGRVSDGAVTSFIPDPDPRGGTSAAEGVAADRDGIIWGAEVGPRRMVRYTRR